MGQAPSSSLNIRRARPRLTLPMGGDVDVLNAALLQDHLVPACVLAVLTVSTITRALRRVLGVRHPLLDSVHALVQGWLAQRWMSRCDLPAEEQQEVNRQVAERIAGLGKSPARDNAQSPPGRRRVRHVHGQEEA